MLCMAKGFGIVFLSGHWYRYLMIFKDFSDADFVVFWQDYQGLQ